MHADLEVALAEWKGTEAALLFPTGFAANTGLLTTLADAPDVLVVSDELNHASIIDGARLARGRIAVARHGDVDHVDDLLADHDGPALVVADSVFSMDGDEAPVAALADVCRRRDALLVLDEAHAVLGPAAPEGSVRVGTLSKALGALGGFVAGPRQVIDLLVNAARPFIFSTAPTPADTAAALAALGVVRSAEGDALVARLRTPRRAGAARSPVTDHPRAPRRRGGRHEGIARAARPGVCSSPPSGRRRCRWAPAGSASPSRRRTPTSRSTVSSPPSRRCPERTVMNAGHERTAVTGGVVYCVGTATEVGKTHVGAAVLTELHRRGRPYLAAKLVQSFDPAAPGPTDAAVLAGATGQPIGEVCAPGRSYPVPMAPPMAAAVLGRSCPTIAELVDDVRGLGRRRDLGRGRGRAPVPDRCRRRRGRPVPGPGAGPGGARRR